MRGPISIAVSGIIGLATETASAIKHRNDADEDERERDLDASDPEDVDNDEWTLDETQAQLEVAQQENAWLQSEDYQDIDAIVHRFIQLHPDAMPPPTYHESEVHRLVNPVIIPQRRPREKSRGFIRAYAPALMEFGIDQKMFMDFLEGFDESIKKQSLFLVANLAVHASSFAAVALVGNPGAIGIATFAVSTTIEIGRRMYIAKKLNTYLFDMNEQVFKPRGLFALVMSYKPKSVNFLEVVDLETSVALSAAHGGDSQSKMRIDSAAVWDESQMPVAAPLIFPGLQAASDQQKQNAIKKASAFYSDYKDRRAQALFSAKDPDSSLNVVPQKKFSSRYADPNHPVNKGGPLAILTGGKISFDNKKREKREQKNLAEGLPKDHGISGGGMLGGLARKLQENVLYLMIVEMPSEEQMKAAAAMEAEAKSQP